MWWSTPCCVRRAPQQKTNLPHLLPTPYSFLLAPYFCGARSARVFFVAKANEGTAENEFRIEFSFRERALGAD